MRQIEELTKDGFLISELGRKQSDLALSSLRIALKAYFSTYETLGRQLRFGDQRESDEERLQRDFNISSNYWDASSESIVHFQHFTELTIKTILREDHDLLSVDVSQNPVLLHKLLHAETLDAESDAGLKSVEAGLALARLISLLKDRRINQKYNVFLNAHSFLAGLNQLRNRIWHRGRFVLRYNALDELIGGHGFSFLNGLASTGIYADLERIWKYSELDCKIDPINEILNEITKPNWSTKKISFLKEMGRSAYANPLINHAMFTDDDEDTKKRSIDRANESLNGPRGHRVTRCPVCGVESLIVFDDMEYDDYHDNPTKKIWYTYAAQCFCCTFEIHENVGNASEHGFKIETYFESREEDL